MVCRKAGRQTLVIDTGHQTFLQAFGSGCCVIMSLGNQAITATARGRSTTALSDRHRHASTCFNQVVDIVYSSFYIVRSTPDAQSDWPNRVRDMSRQPGLPAETELAQLQDSSWPSVLRSQLDMCFAALLQCCGLEPVSGPRSLAASCSKLAGSHHPVSRTATARTDVWASGLQCT